MDTTTYAAVAVLPWSIAQSRMRAGIPEADLNPLDFSSMCRSWIDLPPQSPYRGDGRS
jgi:hypothetical protein